MIQDNGTRPEARESMAKSRQSLMRIVREPGDIAGQIDFLFVSGSDVRAFDWRCSSWLSSSSERRPSASTSSI